MQKLLEKSDSFLLLIAQAFFFYSLHNNSDISHFDRQNPLIDGYAMCTRHRRVTINETTPPPKLVNN